MPASLALGTNYKMNSKDDLLKDSQKKDAVCAPTACVLGSDTLTTGKP